jgi:hypothetical protein
VYHAGAGEGRARCRVFTFKDGMLSGLGHDLEFEIERLAIHARPDGSIAGKFELRSLALRGAVQDGHTSAMSGGDRSRIEEAAHKDVLHTHIHEVAELNGTLTASASAANAPAGAFFSGTLLLCGRSNPLRVPVDVSGAVWRATVELAPSTYGIKPFRAMLGALKLQDRVRVELEVEPLEPRA